MDKVPNLRSGYKVCAQATFLVGNHCDGDETWTHPILSTKSRLAPQGNVKDGRETFEQAMAGDGPKHQFRQSC